MFGKEFEMPPTTSSESPSGSAAANVVKEPINCIGFLLQEQEPLNFPSPAWLCMKIISFRYFSRVLIQRH